MHTAIQLYTFYNISYLYLILDPFPILFLLPFLEAWFYSLFVLKISWIWRSLLFFSPDIRMKIDWLYNLNNWWLVNVQDNILSFYYKECITWWLVILKASLSKACGNDIHAISYSTSSFSFLIDTELHTFHESTLLLILPFY